MLGTGTAHVEITAIDAKSFNHGKQRKGRDNRFYRNDEDYIARNSRILLCTRLLLAKSF